MCVCFLVDRGKIIAHGQQMGGACVMYDCREGRGVISISYSGVLVIYGSYSCEAEGVAQGQATV